MYELPITCSEPFAIEREARAIDAPRAGRAEVGRGEVAEIVQNAHDHGIDVVDRVDERDAVIAAGDRQDEVARAVTADRDIRLNDADAEFEDAKPVGRAVRLDPVLPVAAVA